MALPSPKAQKPDAPFDNFESLDLRVAKVVSAPLAEGTRSPCRVITLDLGQLGKRISIGQYALVDEAELVGKNVVVCINLGKRKMGSYVSEVLVMGTPHPHSPDAQSQALPLFAHPSAQPGESVF